MSEISSDFLEEQFGPSEIEIIYQDELTRIISTETASGQVLELSRVEFEPDVIGRFREAHLRVIRGESMGKVFRDCGIEFVRDTRASFRCALPPIFGRLFGSDDQAILMYVTILVGPDQVPYARVLETYTPLLKKYQHLKSDFPDENLSDKIELLNQELERQ